jgi:hypothetical protein
LLVTRSEATITGAILAGTEALAWLLVAWAEAAITGAILAWTEPFAWAILTRAETTITRAIFTRAILTAWSLCTGLIFTAWLFRTGLIFLRAFFTARAIFSAGSFGLRLFAGLLIGMFPELLNLFFGQHPPCANRQICQGQWALTNTNKPQHLIAKQFSDFTNLPFPAFA